MDKLFIAATWTPNVECPACGSPRVETRRTMPIDEDTHTRIRYHRCRSVHCQAIFKSVEELPSANSTV